MGVAKNIEKRLEGLVEGFFTRVFRSGLQPVEVGRRILREMADGRTVSVNRTYAPNEFRISLGPDDFGRFTQMEAGLQREFAEIVIDQAKDNRWNLMGAPKISFIEDEAKGRGEFAVEASLTADPDVPGPRISTRQPGADDAGATRAIPSDAVAGLGLTSAAELVVLDDDRNPKERIAITSSPVRIGRISNNDVVLSDGNVSRRHAELRHVDGGWVLVDLGSTNGTLVNDKLAKEHALKDGDRLSFGKTELIFRLADG